MFLYFITFEKCKGVLFEMNEKSNILQIEYFSILYLIIERMKSIINQGKTEFFNDKWNEIKEKLINSKLDLVKSFLWCKFTFRLLEFKLPIFFVVDVQSALVPACN